MNPVQFLFFFLLLRPRIALLAKALKRPAAFLLNRLSRLSHGRRRLPASQPLTFRR